jgi:hypothetical protein
MHRTLLLRAALSAAALAHLACGPDALPVPLDVRSYHVAGADRVVPGSPGTDGLEEIAALTDQASRDLGCPASAIHAREAVKQLVYGVDGCQRSGIYLLVLRAGLTHLKPYGDRLTRLHVARFVLISGDDAVSPLRDLAREQFSEDATALGDRYPSQYVFGPLGVRTLDAAIDLIADWTELNVSGARDLACPRGEVLVDFRLRVPGGRPTDTTILTEGCGQRAVYVRAGRPHAFDLASRVPVSR